MIKHISYHINNIYRDEELEEDITYAKLHILVTTENNSILQVIACKGDLIANLQEDLAVEPKNHFIC